MFLCDGHTLACQLLPSCLQSVKQMISGLPNASLLLRRAFQLWNADGNLHAACYITLCRQTMTGTELLTTEEHHDS